MLMNVIKGLNHVYECDKGDECDKEVESCG